MNKIAAVVLAFMLLFSVVAAAEDTALLDGDDTDARVYADMLEAQYGVPILIGNECLDVIQQDVFSVGSQAPNRSVILGQMKIKHTDEELEKLDKALSHYPADLFMNIKDENAPKGIRFLIADQIIERRPERLSVGFSACEDAYYNIILAHTLFDQYTVHHEIWHVMEWYIKKKYPGIFLSWGSLNPPGFKYSNDYKAITADYDPNYFVWEYSTLNAEEDRATIAEEVFYEDGIEWFSEHPFISKKLNSMNMILRESLGIQYNVKTAEVEKCQAN